MNLLKSITNIDRRWIYLGLIGSVLLPRFLPGMASTNLNVPEETRDLYNMIEALPEGSPILLSFDFDPGSKPELYPAARAILKHAFRKKLKIVATCLWPAGTGMAAQDIRDVAVLNYGGSTELADERYGKDYVFLGWRPGEFAVMIQLGENLKKAYEIEFYGEKTDSLPILKGIEKLADFSLVVSISAGSPGLLEWVQYGQGKYQIQLGGAVTGVSAPEMYKFVKAGQLVGLIGGMKGAAGYETLIESPDYASFGITAISASHFYVIGLIILSNIAFLLGKMRT